MGIFLATPLVLHQSKRLAKERKDGIRLISMDFKIQRGTSGKWGGEFGNSLWQKGAAELIGMN
jgi:hypothetical protein